MATFARLSNVAVLRSQLRNTSPNPAMKQSAWSAAARVLWANGGTRRPWAGRIVQVPYPTAWDWYFSRRRPAFLLIRLVDGSVIGGHWGERSYASSYPEHGDLYVSTVCKVDEAGRFEAPVEDTDGLLIRKDQYRYIELLKVPVTEVAHEQEGVRPSKPEDQSGRR